MTAKTLVCALGLSLFFGALACAIALPAADAFSAAPAITATVCPTATPEPLWVEPITSPSTLLLQTVVVYIGNGDRVTVSAPAGVFTAAGIFDAYQHPARVQIQLAPCANPLRVTAHVRRMYQGGCVYGDYTLTATRDRSGQPLLVEREPCARLYLPLVLKQ